MIHIQKIHELLQNVPGGYTNKRSAHLKQIMGRLTRAQLRKLRIETCARNWSDPYRYGRQNGREGQSELIGSSRHNGGTQIWAVWS